MIQMDTVDQWKGQRWANFQKHLKFLCVSNSFQKNRWPGLSEWGSLNGFDDFVQACPLTCKTELEKDWENSPPHGTNQTCQPDDYVRFSRTSGTMGKARVWMDTEEDWQWMVGNWKRILNAAGVKKADRCFFAFSFGPFLGFWTAYEAALQAGCVCIPGGGQSSEARLEAILGQKVEYLFCTPTYALRLIETAKDHQISLLNHSLKKIIVAGECGGSSLEVRKVIDLAWGGKSLFFDHYGMTEVGPVAYEIPGGQGGLRILLDSYHPEVVGLDTTNAVGDGELGELVLTPLGRTGTPVLRYRTGDLVRASEGVDELGFPTFDLVGGILGRVDDMVVIRGINLYPSAVDGLVRAFPEVSEYQVIVSQSRGMKEVSMRAECDPMVATAVEAAMHTEFSLRVPVEPLPKDSLPRSEMKARRWVHQGAESK